MENKRSLYNLTTEYQNLYNKLIESADDDGVVDIAISQALAVKEKEFTEKAVAVATVYRKFDNEIALYDQEIKRLQDYKKRLEKCRNRVKENLSVACQSVGIEKIDGMYANISFRASESVEIDDLSLIPETYLVKTIKLEPAKNLIKAAIQSGIDINGAHIEKKKNIQIK